MVFRRREQGVSTVEMAAILPILIVLVVGAVDLGRVYYAAVVVENAARPGASYGYITRQMAKKSSIIEEFAHADAIDVNGGITVSTSRSCECSDGSSIDCDSSTCATGYKSVYVRVTASKTFETMLSYPGIPSSVSIVRETVMQSGAR